MLGSGLAGKRLLIVGPGRIGRETARLAEAFGAVAYATRAATTTCSRCCRTADIVSLHCPLTADTRHLIGRAELAAMAPGGRPRQHGARPDRRRGRARRGAASGAIAGAALDVYEHEPRRARGAARRSRTSSWHRTSAARRATRGSRWGCSASARSARCCSRGGCPRTPSSALKWSARRSPARRSRAGRSRLHRRARRHRCRATESQRNRRSVSSSGSACLSVPSGENRMSA